MCAFLPTPVTFSRNLRDRPSVCSRRPLATRARVHVSAATEEVKPLDNPNSADGLSSPPSRRTSPHSPRSFRSSSDRPPRPNGRYREDRDNRAPPPPFVPDPLAKYYTKCGSCQAAYEIDPEVLGRGKKVSCSVCGNQWYQKPERLLVLKDTEGFKDYPMDRKDELMKKSQQERRDRSSRRDDRRDYRGDRRAPRARAQFSVFIGNLPFSVTQEELEAFVSSKVNANRIAIVKDPSGRPKGFAFADLSSEEEVQHAVDALDGQTLGGRTIAVKAGRKNSA